MFTLELIADSKVSLFENVCNAKVIAGKIMVEVVFKFNGHHTSVFPYSEVQDVIDKYNEVFEQRKYLHNLANGIKD